VEDFVHFDGLLSQEEILARDNVRRFVDAEVTPLMLNAFESAQFPTQLIKRLADLRIFGMTLPENLGGAGANSVVYGLVCQELERGDSGLRSFVSVQNALSMFPIAQFGSDAHRKRYLAKMAAGEMLGCFGLTEPNAGSDPGAMETKAKKVEGGYQLNGSKAWITNAPIADVAIVWAKTEDGIRGFLVEKGTPGFTSKESKHKLSMRASCTGELFFQDCFVPDENLLPGTSTGLVAALKCLSEARYGIAWGAMGAAQACYEIALDYAKTRVQFGAPLGTRQLIQKDLVEMLNHIVKAQLLNLQVGRLKDAKKVSFPMISLAKMNGARDALTVARLARNILGGNGISLEYHVIRHMANLETVFTYEGTDNIHHLIVGKHITGLDAF
jgi:glutaryl-CoA dehydrogenase